MTKRPISSILFFAILLCSSAAVADPVQITLFSEAGYWGNRLDRVIYPTNSSARYYVIRYSDIKQEGLQNAISSTRLSCSDRGAQVYLSDNKETSTSIYSWNGNIVFLRCEAGEEAQVNLHSKNAYPSRDIIADDVKSVLVILDPEETNDSTVITLFAEAGYWGKEYRIVQRSRNQPIFSMELYGLGLLYALSSVRMECGAYGAHLQLYSEQHHPGDVGGGYEATLQCTADQTTEFNLHNVWGESGFTLGDAVRSLNISTIF